MRGGLDWMDGTGSSGSDVYDLGSIEGGEEERSLFIDLELHQIIKMIQIHPIFSIQTTKHSQNHSQLHQSLISQS